MPRPLSNDKFLVRGLESATTPLVVFDSERRIVFANSALSQWLGIDAKTLIGQRGEYHAGGEEGLAAIAAGLGPPPEAFAGNVSDGFVSRAQQGDRPFDRRSARFLLIEGNGSGGALLVVAVLPASKEGGAASSGGFTAAELHGLLLRVRSELGKRFHISQLIGVSEPIRRLREQIRVASEVRANVTVTGPVGSGREHVARTIHYAGAGAASSLAPIACPLVDAEQMQAALTKALKHKDAASGQRPTVLLLEVDRLRPEGQQELAGFLKLPGVNLRILATTRASLTRRAAQGRFRADLAFALSTLTLSLPSLRHRPEDIPVLAQHFLEECNADRERQLSGFQLPALELLARLPWPGNVDQLGQAVREACARAAGLQVGVTDLADWVHLAGSARPPAPPMKMKLDEFLANVEKDLLSRALAASKGNKSKAAQMLGLSRPRLLRRLAQLGILEAGAVDEPVQFEQVPDEPS
jgi:transcriptional regulator with PAS, ATPase and Fis domain